MKAKEIKKHNKKIKRQKQKLIKTLRDMGKTL